MNDRVAAKAAGVLFITATVTDILSAVVRPPLDGADAVAAAAAQPVAMTVSVVLLVVAAFACAGIALAMWPVLRQADPALALGSVGFRAIESTGYLLGAVAMLAMLAIGRDAAVGGAAEAAVAGVAGVVLAGLREAAGIPTVLAFCVGATLYYVVLFRARLVPRWLSGWGVIAIVMLAAACLLGLFAGRPVTAFVVLALPILVQEMVLAVWLIAKGFRTTVATAPDASATAHAAAPAATAAAASR